MCLAVPMRVKSIRGDEAEVECSGIIYRASLRLTPEVKVGDYILIHTGYAIAILEREQAEETLKLLLELDDIGEYAET
jgi:hydrogenase expression/formation protein HypC